MEGEMVDSEDEFMGTFKKYKISSRERAILIRYYNQWVDAAPLTRAKIYQSLERELNALGRRLRAPVNELWNHRLIAKWYYNEQSKQ
jgi:hypothetical protein